MKISKAFKELSFAEKGAMLGTRELLDKGLVRAVEFNMNLSCVSSNEYIGCGTIACIGGTMGQIMYPGDLNKAHRYVMGIEEGEPIHRLFFPDYRINYEKITRAEAVKAIDNFIAKGDPKWMSIVHKSKVHEDE